jgi:2-polyprenyl-3-methyl-5-hydroxy-6-metoxy-1,4-benzoquinol methylase
VLPRLKEQSQQFHEYLFKLKQSIPLEEGLQWYPWPTLAGFDVLDEMLAGDTNAMLRMIGRLPVLDVGCGDGDTTFFLESLGVTVDAVDHAPTNYNALYGVKKLKGVLNSPARIEAIDIDTRPEFPQERYGLTILLGVLYHLKNPYLVLETLAQKSSHIFLSTRVAQLAPDRKTGYGGNPVAYLVEADELNADYTNYWIFTEECLKRILRRSGWDVQHFIVKGAKKSDPVSPDGDARAYVVAKSRVVAPRVKVELADGWCGLEEEQWRWTRREFGFDVAVDEALPNANLRLRFHIHEALLAAHPQVTMRVRFNGRELPPATYKTAGSQIYSAQIGLIEPGDIRVQFALDRTIPAEIDDRELGVQVKFADEPPLTLP